MLIVSQGKRCAGPASFPGSLFLFLDNYHESQRHAIRIRRLLIQVSNRYMFMLMFLSSSFQLIFICIALQFAFFPPRLQRENTKVQVKGAYAQIERAEGLKDRAGKE